MKHDHITRAIKVLLVILKKPATKRSLAEEFGCHIDTINNIFKNVKSAGIQVTCSGYPDYKYMAHADAKIPKSLRGLSKEEKALRQKERHLKWRINHREEYLLRNRERSKKYREKNREKHREASQKWRRNRSAL